MASDKGKKMSECNFKCRLDLTGREMGGLFKQVEQIEKNTNAIMESLEKQNGRIGRLERWRSYILGIIGAAGFFIGVYLRYYT